MLFNIIYIFFKSVNKFNKSEKGRNPCAWEVYKK